MRMFLGIFLMLVGTYCVYSHNKNKTLLKELAAAKIVLKAKRSYVPQILQNINPPRETAFTLPKLETLITIKTKEDIKTTRALLRTYLFGSNGTYGNENELIMAACGDQPFLKPFENDNTQCKQLTVRMEYGIESTIFYFKQSIRTKLTVFYLDSTLEEPALSFLKDTLAQGNSAAVLFMPLKGPNNRPSVAIAPESNVIAREWTILSYLSPKKGHSEKFFLLPLLQFIDFVEKENSHDSISVIGVGTGSWPAMVCSAIDPRLNFTACLSGPFPFFISTYSRQSIEPLEFPFGSSDIFRIAGHLDQYLMCSAGKSFVMIYRKFDAPYYSESDNKVMEQAVTNALRKIGRGQFVSLIEEDQRLLSEKTRDIILN